jgi:hypothetical protein
MYHVKLREQVQGHSMRKRIGHTPQRLHWLFNSVYRWLAGAGANELLAFPRYLYVLLCRLHQTVAVMTPYILTVVDSITFVLRMYD